MVGHMQTIVVTERQIVNELQGLEPEKWSEVLDFNGHLKQRKVVARKAQPLSQGLTARDLPRSDLVGIWADREDLGASPEFARSLRRQADNRCSGSTTTL
jgi:hypothetical protein